MDPALEVYAGGGWVAAVAAPVASLVGEGVGACHPGVLGEGHKEALGPHVLPRARWLRELNTQLTEEPVEGKAKRRSFPALCF